MSKRKRGYCPCCDQTMWEHKHGLSIGLVRSLLKLAKRGQGEHRICEFLTTNEYTNFSKTQFWQLAEKAGEQHKGGHWKITPKGLEFLMGGLPLPRFVWVYRNEVIEYEGEERCVEDVTDGWKFRGEYAKDARPHFPDPQGDLDV